MERTARATYRNSGRLMPGNSSVRRMGLGGSLDVHPHHLPDVAVRIFETAAINEAIILLGRWIGAASGATGFADDGVDVVPAVGGKTDQHLAGGPGVRDL